MKQATAKLYIRFGELPKDGKSRVHISGEPCVEEAGVSVYRAIEANALEGAGLSNLHLETRVDSEDLIIMINNNGMRRGLGKLING